MNNLERFVIKNLFNEYNVDLDLKNNVNIFVGENGMGKTTILNCLYSVLSGRIEGLMNIPFEEISVVFNDSKTPIVLLKKDLLAYMEGAFNNRHRRISFDVLRSLFSISELNRLKEISNLGLVGKSDLEPYIYRITDSFHMPSRIAYEELRTFIEYEFCNLANANEKSVVTFKKEISSRVTEEILYFPTYRRIEEDMTKLGLDIDNERSRGIKKRLIQFGMSDVERTIDGMLETIKGAAITGFNKMTGVLLHQYINGNDLVPEDEKIDFDKLNITLNRIGDQIDETDKEKIRDLAESGKLYERQNKYLLNLVQNLIQSYNKQSYYDEKIKNFRDVCNGFLEGKQYVYNESDLTLDIYKPNSSRTIQLKNLSSGEKQIISVFSKLYLEANKIDEQKKFIILFDEPELSLSIKWQAHFLPDIMKSKKCSKLITVTHSPFIFENEYDRLANDMGMCITEVDSSEC